MIRIYILSNWSATYNNMVSVMGIHILHGQKHLYSDIWHSYLTRELLEVNGIDVSFEQVVFVRGKVTLITEQSFLLVHLLYDEGVYIYIKNFL